MKEKDVVAIIGTLDTKGKEIKYIRNRVEAHGMETLIIDSGTGGEPEIIEADLTREEIANAADKDFDEIAEMPRGKAVEKVSDGLGEIVNQYGGEKIDGALGVGGRDGAILITSFMKELPEGIPKVILSPIFQGAESFGMYADETDITMMHSVIDVEGVNEISKSIFDNAVAATVGMVEHGAGKIEVEGEKLVSATIYGNTTPGVKKASKYLEERGYEIVTFHSNGTGGRAMENMAQRKIFTGILDYTPSEITNYLFNGADAAKDRILENGTPRVIVPGCLDFFLLHNENKDSWMPKYKARQIYEFDPSVSMIKVSKEEAKKEAEYISKLINKNNDPIAMVFPLQGLSMYSKKGNDFYDPEIDKILLENFKENLESDILFIEVDAHINEEKTAHKAAQTLIDLIKTEND